jgi:hypothetical protein
MLGRVVITSVPRGLDGGAGFQTVLRTHGMQPSVAERLAARAAYPHPFPFGDPRNPHVRFHRIERVGDRMIHVLGSIRDAGSSYTGRSNHLAELIAIDPAETRGLPGGPAFATLAFPWLGRWTGEPRAVPLPEEVAIPGHDPSDLAATRLPAHCPAWEKATGDAGWAGELAQSFLDGRRALIWAGDTVNVLELFTEALRLLPANVRWQVTFNTCEIEPFPAHWRAVRPELGLVGNYEPTNELRLVLGKIRESRSRAPDHDLSRQARGEAPALETGSAPSGDRGTESLTHQDDAALRAQLREISETRRRRTGPAVAARPATRTPGMHRWIKAVILGVALLCIGIGVVTLAVRLSRVAPSDSDLHLRSASEEDERAARSAEEKKRAQNLPAEQAKDAAPARADPGLDKGVAQVRPVPGEAIPPEEDNERAVETPVPHPDKHISLSVSGPENDLSVETAPRIRTYELCDARNLISPVLEMATPYKADDHRLLVSKKTDSDAIRWEVSGRLVDTSAPHNAENSSPKMIDVKDAGEIVVVDKKLVLKLKVGVQNRLTEMLENSLLMIMTSDGHTNEPRLFQRIYFYSEPTRLHALPDLQFEVFEESTKIFDPTLASRVSEIPANNFEWEVECRPQSGELLVLKKDSDTMLPLRFYEPNLIEYKDVGEDGVLRTRQESVAVKGTLSFKPAEVAAHYTPCPEPEGLENSPFHDAFSSLEFLREPGRQDKLIEEAQAKLREEIFRKLFERFRAREPEEVQEKVPDSLTSLYSKISTLEMSVRTEIKVPGSSYPLPGGFGMETYQNKEEFTKKTEQRQKDVGTLAVLKDFVNRLESSVPWRKVKMDYPASLRMAKERFRNAIGNSGPFGHFSVRLRRLTVLARDKEGQQYPIHLVEPATD